MNSERRLTDTLAMQYLLALSAVGAGLGVRFAMGEFFSDYGFPFICFFPAVLAGAFATSLWPSLTAAALSVGLAWYYLLAPARAWWPLSDTDLVGVAFFAFLLVVDCIVIHFAKQSMRRAPRPPTAS